MYPFPSRLEDVLLSLSHGQSLNDLAHHYEALSHAYRRNEGYQLCSFNQALAYVMGRMPATYAVLCAVLEQYTAFTTLSPTSCLDIGSGPGTGYWALKAIDIPITSLTCVEPNPFMREIARKTMGDPSIPMTNLSTLGEAAPHDLVIASYVVGELTSDAQQSFIRALWNLTKHTLILTGPGTPAGFRDMAALRTSLVEQNANIFAPCGHEALCPLLAAHDWCHFSARLERRPFHKILKGATQGYEDEKFVYLIATRDPFPFRGERILKKPRQSKGRIVLDTCAGDHVNMYTFLKSQTPDFQKMKKLKWGDLLKK